MRKLLLVLLALAAPVLLSAQAKVGKPLIDSLESVLPTVKEDTTRASLLADISIACYNVDPDKALKYAEDAMTLATKLDWAKGLAKANEALGIAYGGKSEYGKAADYYTKAVELFTKIGDQEGLGKTYSNMGANYETQGEYPKALETYFKGLKIFESTGNQSMIARVNGNIGVVYSDQKDYKKALEYYLRSLAVNEKLKNTKGMAGNYNNLGSTYRNMGELDRSLEYYFKALNVNKDAGVKSSVARNLGNIAVTYSLKKDFITALNYYNQALNIRKEQGDKRGMGIDYSNISNMYLTLVKESGDPMVDKALQQLFDGSKSRALSDAQAFGDSSLELYHAIGDLSGLKQTYLQQSQIQALQGDTKAALYSFQQHSVFKDSLFNLEKDKKLTQAAMQYEFDKKEAAQKADQDKKDIRERTIRNSIAGGLAGALIFLGIVYRQRNRISSEKKRSEELLLNILPGEVAEELKAKGEADAKFIDEVTVLFTDFKEFTALTESLSPKDLVQDIHECFSAFDHIMEKHGMEKIKSIGDAYMAAGGLPTPNKTHVADAVNAAVEMLGFIEANKARKTALGLPYFEVRIGIHTGPVVAGIVGVKKFQYDIWGDTVNTASRMETSGEVGRINISGATYDLVKDKFACQYRGKVTAKGKGEIDMYFVG
jgi:adenylate cyclase